MSESLFHSEGRTESLYRLQTVPLETYVLNYVLASTIGNFRARWKTKNPHQKVRKKSVNTKENRESYDSRFLVRVFITDLKLRHSDEVVQTYSQRTENACVYKEFCNTKGI